MVDYCIVCSHRCDVVGVESLSTRLSSVCCRVPDCLLFVAKSPIVLIFRE